MRQPGSKAVENRPVVSEIELDYSMSGNGRHPIYVIGEHEDR